MSRKLPLFIILLASLASTMLPAQSAEMRNYTEIHCPTLQPQLGNEELRDQANRSAALYQNQDFAAPMQVPLQEFFQFKEYVQHLLLENEKLKKRVEGLELVNANYVKHIKNLEEWKSNSTNISPFFRKLVFGAGCVTGLYLWLHHAPYHFAKSFIKDVNEAVIETSSIILIAYWLRVSFE